jgi:hypothetical protein
VTSLCRRLLLRQAFSELRHFSWDIDPANTMAYDIKEQQSSLLFILIDHNMVLGYNYSEEQKRW